MLAKSTVLRWNMLLRMLPVSYYGQNYAGIVHQRLLLYEHTTKTALIEMYYASFCQTTAVTGQDCEQYTLCGDCIAAPNCVWCNVSIQFFYEYLVNSLQFESR